MQQLLREVCSNAIKLIGHRLVGGDGLVHRVKHRNDLELLFSTRKQCLLRTKVA